MTMASPVSINSPIEERGRHLGPTRQQLIQSPSRLRMLSAEPTKLEPHNCLQRDSMEKQETRIKDTLVVGFPMGLLFLIDVVIPQEPL